MTPHAVTGYYQLTAARVVGTGSRVGIDVHRAASVLQGSANETGLSIADAFTNHDVCVDHITGRKSLYAGDYKPVRVADCKLAPITLEWAHTKFLHVHVSECVESDFVWPSRHRPVLARVEG